MRISRQSKFVKWCYLTGFIPSGNISICILFWRGFLISPLVVLYCLACVAAAISLVGGIVYLMAINAIGLWILGASPLFILLALWIKHFQKDTPKENVAVTVFVERIKAVKKKVCPIVEFY